MMTDAKRVGFSSVGIGVFIVKPFQPALIWRFNDLVARITHKLLQWQHRIHTGNGATANNKHKDFARQPVVVTPRSNACPCAQVRFWQVRSVGSEHHAGCASGLSAVLSEHPASVTSKAHGSLLDAGRLKGAGDRKSIHISVVDSQAPPALNHHP
jgi:hypothetical protein